MAKLFGTDGIRGKANTFPLDSSSMELLGYSLGKVIGSSAGHPLEVIIGYDTRESSIHLLESISRGFNACKGKILNAGIISTPVLSFLASYFSHFAIAITASHNPYGDNGVKIFGPDGLKLPDDKECEIEDFLLQKEHLPLTPAQAISIEDISQNAHDLYYNKLIKKNFPTLDLHSFNIAIDVAHGSGYRIIPSILRQMGGNIFVYNDRPDGKNINNNCGALHPEYLSQCIINKEMHIGISFDGDADRAIFCDNTGRVYDGDMILAMIGLYLKSKRKLKNNAIVATIMSNYGLEKYLASHEIQLLRVPVGDKNVLEKMIELDLNLGGEQSGHIILSDILKTGDGLITALMAMSIIKESQMSVESLIKGFERYPQILVNVNVQKKAPLESVPELYKAYQSIQEKLKKDGRLVIRYSGTEPLMRIMIEGPHYQEIHRYADMLSRIAKKHLN